VAGLIPPDLASRVERHRVALNAAFAAHRAGHPRIDADGVLRAFASLAETARAALADRPDAIDALIEPLFAISLELAGPRGRLPGLEAHLGRFIALVPHAVSREPDRLLRDAANAYRTLFARCVSAPERWTALMAGTSRLAPTPDELRRYGAIAAWRAGLAEFRQAAIASIGASGSDAVRALLGISDNVAMPDPAAFAAALADNPWADPAALAAGSAQPRACFAAIGGFSAFGGVFAAPPVVFAQDGVALAHDGTRCFEIIADRFGAHFAPAGAAPGDRIAPDPSVVVGPSAIVAHGISIALRDIAPVDPNHPLPDLPVVPVRGSAFDGHAVYLTTPLSYRVFVVGIAGAGA